MDKINLKSLALTDEKLSENKLIPKHGDKKVPRHQPGEKFLKGPIGYDLLKIASSLPGKALSVYLAIWYRVGLEKKPTIKLTGSVLEDFGVDRYACYRALTVLEKAGLIACKRHVGRKPIITVLNPHYSSINSQPEKDSPRAVGCPGKEHI